MILLAFRIRYQLKCCYNISIQNTVSIKITVFLLHLNDFVWIFIEILYFFRSHEKQMSK